MEHDKHLRQVLMHSSEGASADFTSAIMSRIDAVPVVTGVYEPLVSNKIKRLFVFTFLSLVAVILLLCLVISLPDFPFIAWLQRQPLSNKLYDDVLIFTVLFWTIFAAHRLITTNKFISRRNFS
jgi:hypothetical protein